MNGECAESVEGIHRSSLRPSHFRRHSLHQAPSPTGGGFGMTSRRRCGIQAVFAVAIAALLESAAKEPIKLHVDASPIQLKIVRVQMEMAVKPGPLTLYYPKWIPGDHAPDGP